MITPDFLETLAGQLEIAVMSFDIFDTLITRPFEKPVQLFEYMHRNAPIVPEDFPEMRVRAEAIAREHAPGNECTISEIYSVLSTFNRYSPRLCQTLCPMELETELRMCMPRKEGARLLARASYLDVRIILISDMYLSKERISRMLCKCALKNFSEIYVSGEVRRSKASGDLYRYVRRMEELPFRTMLHIGDNSVSDVIIPRNLGMHALYFPLQEGKVLTEPKGLVDRVLLPYGSIRRRTAGRIEKLLKTTIEV
ncbi:MAG: hypothetical protein IJ055_10775 [Oscillospiraceae bacterium]|nr:hypothetical protein [Oscillospiraceae bacterium]